MYNEEARGVALEETFVLRRESRVFRITERRERLAGEKPPERRRAFLTKRKRRHSRSHVQSHVSSHVSSHERSFALCITSQRALEPSSVRALERRRRLARRAPYFFFFLAAPSFASFASSRTQHRSIGVLAHALVTFAASMSVTAFLPAFTCAWTRSMAAAASVSSRAARADESPTRELNRL